MPPSTLRSSKASTLFVLGSSYRNTQKRQGHWMVRPHRGRRFAKFYHRLLNYIHPSPPIVKESPPPEPTVISQDHESEESSYYSSYLPSPSSSSVGSLLPAPLDRDLPYGWEERSSPAGWSYYVDHLAGTVNLDRPVGARRAFLLNHPDVADDLTTLPKYRPADETYSLLIDQLISIHRTTKKDTYTSTPLLELLFTEPGQEETSDESLRETLQGLLEEDIPTGSRVIIDYTFTELSSRVEKRESANIPDVSKTVLCNLRFAPPEKVDPSSAEPSDPVLSGCEPCVKSSVCSDTQTTLKKDQAWCYLCLMDFDVIGGPELVMRSCGHLFHSKCFGRRARAGFTACPLCAQRKGRETILMDSMMVDLYVAWNESQRTAEKQADDDSGKSLNEASTEPEGPASTTGKSRQPLIITHPLINDIVELARLKDFGRNYQQNHIERPERERQARLERELQAEQRRREREQKEAVRQDRKRRNAKHVERLKRERQGTLDKFPSLLHLATSSGAIQTSSGTLFTDQRAVSVVESVPFDDTKPPFIYEAITFVDEPATRATEPPIPVDELLTFDDTPWGDNPLIPDLPSPQLEETSISGYNISMDLSGFMSWDELPNAEDEDFKHVTLFSGGPPRHVRALALVCLGYVRTSIG